MKKSIVLLAVLLNLYPKLNAQVIGELNVLDRDLANFNYIPPNGVTDDFDYQRFSGKISLPSIRNGNFSIFNSVGLDVHKFDYEMDDLGLELSSLDQYYNINLSAFTNYRLSDKWSINGLLAPFILSNLAESLSSDDLKFNGYVFIERTLYRKKGGYLLLDFGAGYLTLNGTTRVNPVISLKGRLSPAWSFVLGLPNTYLKWDFHQKQSIKLLGDINDFSANLNGAGTFASHGHIDQAVFTTVSAGAEYNYWITSAFGIMIRMVQPIWSDYELRNTHNDTVFEFDTDFQQPMVNIGVKFNPIRSIQNGLEPY